MLLRRTREMLGGLAIVATGFVLGCGTDPASDTEPGADVGTPQPDTTIADTAVPDSTTPDTTVPDSTVPDASPPDTTAPDTTIADTTVPDTTAPDTTIPDVSPDVDGCRIPEPAVHRPASLTCDPTRPPGDTPEDWGAPHGCESDAECTEGLNGRCTGNGRDGWWCTYDTCFSDSECNGGVCHCDGGFRSGANVCKPGNCQSDADCGAGSWCSPTLGDCGEYGGTVGWYCRTCQDECLHDSDCEGSGPWGGSGYCMFDRNVAHWVCGYQMCAG